MVPIDISPCNPVTVVAKSPETGQLAWQNFMRQFPDHDITGAASGSPHKCKPQMVSPHFLWSPFFVRLYHI